MKMCKRCINTTNNPSITIGDDGICNVCKDFEKNYDEKVLDKELEFLRKFIRKEKTNNCMVALSGGKDSSAMLYSVKELGFNPLAFTFEIGYNILTDSLKDKINRVCRNIGVKHEYIDVHSYVTDVDRECFKLTAEMYDKPITNETSEKFKKIYYEGRKHYSTKDNTIMPFVRPCQICRKIAIRAYYGEAIKHNIRIVFVGINEWSGLSGNKYTAIRELKPFEDMPSVYIVHFPFLIHRKISDLDEILNKIGWSRENGDNKVDTGGSACMLARIAESKSTEMLGFNVDESRLSREITAGFLNKEDALNAISNYQRPVTKTMKKVLKESGLL